jgi:cation diffusion facilitator family transporter
MNDTQAQSPYRDQVRRTLWRVLAVNLAVAAIKIAVGLLTRSLAMVADGFHSTLDASSNVIGLLGNALAARPPDESHPYGHERFETIATLAIGGLLLGAAVEIGRGVVQRLVTGGTPAVSQISYAAMLVTLAVNVATVIYERRTGRALKSELLLADAAHTTTDVYVSLLVLVSLVVVSLGVAWFDVAMAAVIVGLIAVTAFQILRRTADVLVDGAATNPSPIEAVAAATPGVSRVTHVRSRGPQGAIHVDVDVDVDAAMTASQTHAIADEIQRRVANTVEGVGEVEVHFTPRREGAPDHLIVSRAVADALGLSVHEVTPVRTPAGVVLDMHVEMDGDLSLEYAHVRATEFERRVRAQLPDVVDVVTHIEPAPTGKGQAVQSKVADDIRRRVLEVAYTLYPTANWHDLRVLQEGDGFALTLHCHLPGEVTLDRAHAIAEQVETQIRAELPQVARVTIHTEPPE